MGRARENPWTTIAMQAIATEAMVAPPDRDRPNMFRCAAPGYVSALYEGTGLRDVAEWDVDVKLVTRSPAQYWEMISEHVSLAVAAVRSRRRRAVSLRHAFVQRRDATVTSHPAGVGRHAVGRPLHRGGQQRLLHCVLARLEVAV
jgi:hypothetical protein